MGVYCLTRGSNSPQATWEAQELPGIFHPPVGRNPGPDPDIQSQVARKRGSHLVNVDDLPLDLA